VAKIRVLVAPALFWLEFTENEDREALKSWEAQNSYQITQDCDYQLFKFAFALPWCQECRKKYKNMLKI
jgi:hypothetical protein